MLPRISIAMRLKFILAMAIAGSLITTGLFYQTLSSVAVHGPAYTRIVQGKDVIADILPPPEYIVESHLTVHQIIVALENGKSEEVTRRIERLKTLKQEFDDRHDFWQSDLQDPEMRVLMLNKLHAPAIEFFSTVESQLIPACEAQNTAAATAVLTGPLTSSYNQHREAVDALTELAIHRNQESEDAVRLEMDRNTKWCIGIVLVTSIVVGGLGNYLINHAIVPLRQKAHVLSAQAIESGNNADSIAAAVRQLDDSIREISQNAHHAETVCATARQSVDKSCTVLHGLSASSNQIGEVIQLIQRITHQTNLLALNATIEAARAGEAGLGFAVVAREVKELASQTNEAASSIIEHIGAIQQETYSALSAIEMVNEVVTAIHESQTGIASAVTQQSGMTMQLARSVDGMASASRLMTETAGQLIGNSDLSSTSQSMYDNDSRTAKNRIGRFDLTTMA